MNAAAEPSKPGDSPWQPSPNHRPIPRWFRIISILLIAIGLIAMFRHPLMRGAASAWIINDLLDKSDAIVLLGGGLETRPFFAAELYKRGLAPIVLMTVPEKSTLTNLHLMPDDVEVTLGVLQKMGVPEIAVQRLSGEIRNTKDEARQTRVWLEAHPSARRIIVPTDPFHTRRVQYIFQRELRGLPVKVLVAAVPHPDKRYDPMRWWQEEISVISFQNEVAKLIYYWLKY